MDVCPFLDRADARCATHMTLADIGYAFAYCANNYTDCPLYRELLADGTRCDEPQAEMPLLAAS